MDANIQFTINSFRQIFPDKIFFPDNSLIFSKIPDISRHSCQIPWHFQVFQTSGHPDSIYADSTWPNYISFGAELTWGRAVQWPTWLGDDLVWGRSDCHCSCHVPLHSKHRWHGHILTWDFETGISGVKVRSPCDMGSEAGLKVPFPCLPGGENHVILWSSIFTRYRLMTKPPCAL